MNGWSDTLLFLIVSLLAIAGLIAAIIGMTLLRRWLRLQLLGERCIRDVSGGELAGVGYEGASRATSVPGV